MTNKKKLIIWVPFPSVLTWSSHGITRSVERLLVHLRDEMSCIVVCNNVHRKVIIDAIGAHKNMTFRVVYQPEFILFESYAHAMQSTLFRFVQLPFVVLQRSMYMFMCLYHAFYIRWMRDVGAVWYPWVISQVLPLKNKHTKITNYWDPFTFDYDLQNEWRSVGSLYKAAHPALEVADYVITQSKHNVGYLSFAHDIEESRIHMINLPYINYQELLPDEVLADCRTRDAIAIRAHWKKYTHSLTASEVVTRNVLQRFLAELEPDTKIFFVSANATRYKGHDALFAVFDYLYRNHPDIKFCVVYTAAMEGYKDAYIKKYPWVFTRLYQLRGLNDYHHAMVYAMSDLVIHPSFAEGGPGAFPLFEGASVGTPTLMNSGRHTKELLDNASDFAPAVADILDVETFAKKIIQLLEDENLRHQIVDTTMAHIDNRADSTDKYMNLFRKVIGDIK